MENTKTVRLEGTAAIEFAAANGLPLCKYTDPTEEAREDLTVEEANAVAREDARLIYIDTDMENTLKIMAAALPIVQAVPASQDSCWPGDGPAHDDDCRIADHAAAAKAVRATEGISWDFSTWSATASWFRRELGVK